MSGGSDFPISENKEQSQLLSKEQSLLKEDQLSSSEELPSTEESGLFISPTLINQSVNNLWVVMKNLQVL